MDEEKAFLVKMVIAFQDLDSDELGLLASTAMSAHTHNLAKNFQAPTTEEMIFAFRNAPAAHRRTWVAVVKTVLANAGIVLAAKGGMKL